MLRGDSMLIYEFPPKLNRIEKQAKAVHDLEEYKKMRQNMFKNLILGIVIIVMGILAKVTLISVVLMIIGGVNIAVGIVVYSLMSLSRDTNSYSRIYEDKIEHKQRIGLSQKYLKCVIYYDEIAKSFQDSHGNMIINFEKLQKSEFSEIDADDKNEKKYEIQNNEIKLKFIDIKSKLTLIEKCSDKIKYPKKNYNIINDEEGDDYYSEEDLKWDKLHKHGL